MGRNGHVLTIYSGGVCNLALYGNGDCPRNKAVGWYAGKIDAAALAWLKAAMADKRFTEFPEPEAFVPEGLAFSISNGQVRKGFGAAMDGPVKTTPFMDELLERLQAIRAQILAGQPVAGYAAEVRNAVLDASGRKLSLDLVFTNPGSESIRLFMPGTEQNLYGGVSFLAEPALGAWQSEYHDYQSVPKGYAPMPTDEGFVDLGPDQTFSISYKVLLPEKDMSMGLASIAVGAQLAAMPVKTSPNLISLPAAPLRLGFYGLTPLEPPLRAKL